MTTQTHPELKEGIVGQLRRIREQISQEIKDMTFEQERAYLDKLLSEKSASNQKEIDRKNAAE